MYCGKCGCRIKERQNVCPECGSPAEYDQYCGGFWGLVGANPAQPAQGYNAVQTPEPTVAPVKKKSGPSPFLFVSIALAVVCCVLAYFVFSLNGKLNNQETEPSTEETVTQSEAVGAVSPEQGETESESSTVEVTTEETETEETETDEPTAPPMETEPLSTAAHQELNGLLKPATDPTEDQEPAEVDTEATLDADDNDNTSGLEDPE